jgi:hypothetical protein
MGAFLSTGKIMKTTIQTVRKGDMIIHPLGTWSSVVAEAPEDGFVISMGMSKSIYLPKDLLTELIDTWDVEDGPMVVEVDPWEEQDEED